QRITRLVDVLEPAAAAVVLAAVDIAAARPPAEQAGPDGLERRDGGRPGALARLLRADHLGAAVVERRRQEGPGGVERQPGADPVVVHRAPQLPSLEHERAPEVEAVRDDAVRLYPVGREEPEGRESVVLEVTGHQRP